MDPKDIKNQPFSGVPSGASNDQKTPPANLSTHNRDLSQSTNILPVNNNDAAIPSHTSGNNVIPSMEEGSFPTKIFEVTPVNENTAEHSPQVEKSNEKFPSLAEQLKEEESVEEEPKDDTNANVLNSAPVKEEPKIVDKSHEKIKLHSLENTADPLTQEADKDEEKFILEVEKHHGLD